MRDFEAGLRNDEIAIEEDVEVEGSRAVGECGGAIAAEDALDREKSVEKWARCETGFEEENGVEKTRLGGKADGRGGIERGTRGDAAEPGEVLEGCGESCVGWPGGAGKVCAESDGCEGHG
jgi:hypothetical protein